MQSQPQYVIAGPAPVAELMRELLRPATGCTFPDGPDGITMTLTNDPDLGLEGYRLTITPAGVRAEGTVTGLRWAVQTMRQLLPPAIYGNELVTADWKLPCAAIVGTPRLPSRGSLLDVGRWFQPIEYLRRYVDLMAIHKLNRLHLHLTDDQGWRFEVGSYPRLTQIGAWRSQSMAGHHREHRYDATRPGGFCTQRELRDLVAYAERRGVQSCRRSISRGTCRLP